MTIGRLLPRIERLRSIRRTSPARTATLALGLAAVSVLVPAPGCSDTSKEPPILVKPDPAPNPLPRFLRGTVRYESELLGYGAAIANGYGIMVGLDGTGSSDIPIPIRTMLEQEAAKRIEDPRIDNPNRLNIDELLNSQDTAVVIVEGLVPPGATVGTRFDLLVRALPGTSTTSLEGGVLWTTELRIQPAQSGQPRVMDPVGTGRGDIFINPFASAVEGEDAPGRTSVNKLVGRILNGGVVTRDMVLFLQLRTPSHSRSRAVTDAINARFPKEYTQRSATAVPVPGQSDERIRITVPPAWGDRTEEFVEVLMHTPIFQAGLEERADGLRRWVMENPVDAQAVSWSFVAIGQKALEPMRLLYDYPELAPRLAALKAGAKLEDPLTIPHLEAIARDPDNEFRLEAIGLLADLPANPRSHTVLRDLLDDRSTDVQIAAFEGLKKNSDPAVQQYSLGAESEFALFSVPSTNPMIYVRQEGEPLVAVFGYDVSIREPLLASAWGTRFMVLNEDPGEPLKVFYQDPKTGNTATYEPSDELPDFIRFLARSGNYRDEAPGLNLNYAETVGVLYALHEQHALGGPLILQKDRIIQAISRRRGARATSERPETNLRFDGSLDLESSERPESSIRPEPSDDQPGADGPG